MATLHYSKAPVIEALVDVVIKAEPRVTLTAVRGVAHPGYRESGLIGAFSSEIGPGNEGPVLSASGGPIGYRFHSTDQKYVLQARTNGLTFSRLEPYERWETFIKEARSAWESYRKVIGDSVIAQFSLRYINRLEIPLGEEISLYLRTFPQVSSDLPQTLNDSFMRLEMALEESGGTLILQQMQEPPKSDDQAYASVILDYELRFEAEDKKLTDSNLWARLNSLRELKNRIFRGCLTPTMERMIA